MKKLFMRTPAGILYMLFAKDVNKLEHDPGAQYHFNRFWAVTWACLMVAIPFIPKLYGHDPSALVIQEISLWANFATHFGAMSSALAAMNTRSTVNDIADDVDDIKDRVSPRRTFSEEVHLTSAQPAGIASF